MTVLKLLETYAMRDALLVVMLCFFVTMTRFLYSQDLMLIFYLFGSAFVTTHALAVLNFEKTKKWFDFPQLKSTASSLTLAIPFAVLFFLVFPRLGAPIWGSPDIFGEGKTGPEYHAKSRPAPVEGEATARAIMLARMTDEPLYVVHVTCRESVEAIAEARGRGQNVVGETCPPVIP